MTHHEFVRGDLLRSRADVLVNPVNCVGTMGAGLAKQFARACPSIIVGYRRACQRRDLLPGKVMLISPNERPGIISLFPTKNHWRDPSRLSWVRDGLRSLRGKMEEHRLSSVAIPPLGCGLGGLSWAEVGPMIVEAFDGSDIHLFLYGKPF